VDQPSGVGERAFWIRSDRFGSLATAILAVKVAKIAKVANVFRIPPSGPVSSQFCRNYWTYIDLRQNRVMLKPK
jgi:hypothetical protein